MVVDANVWYWTAKGMTTRDTGEVGYIERREVERLLEEAHARGKRQGLEQAIDIVKGAPA